MAGYCRGPLASRAFLSAVRWSGCTTIAQSRLARCGRWWNTALSACCFGCWLRAKGCDKRDRDEFQAHILRRQQLLREAAQVHGEPERHVRVQRFGHILWLGHVQPPIRPSQLWAGGRAGPAPAKLLQGPTLVFSQHQQPAVRVLGDRSEPSSVLTDFSVTHCCRPGREKQGAAATLQRRRVATPSSPLTASCPALRWANTSGGSVGPCPGPHRTTGCCTNGSSAAPSSPSAAPSSPVQDHTQYLTIPAGSLTERHSYLIVV